MAAKPQKLCYLKTGKALGAFPDFVATWNWLVSFCHNLKGEGDDETGEETESDKVRVDKSVDDHPVIRGGSGGGGGSGSVVVVGTDGSEATVTASGKLTFATAADSNVVVNVTQTDSDNATATIGVYWK